MIARIYYQVKKQDVIYIHTHTHAHRYKHTTHTLFYYVTKKKHKSIYTYLFIIRKTECKPNFYKGSYLQEEWGKDGRGRNISLTPISMPTSFKSQQNLGLHCPIF